MFPGPSGGMLPAPHRRVVPTDGWPERRTDPLADRDARTHLKRYVDKNVMWMKSSEAIVLFSRDETTQKEVVGPQKGLSEPQMAR